MGEKGRRVENYDAVRDANTGAIVFNNIDDYTKAKKRKTLLSKLNSIETRLEKLELMLERIVQDGE